MNVDKNHHYKLLTEIKEQVNPIYFGHMSLIFSICNDKDIRKCKEVQDPKILKLGKNSLSRNNPDKVIYNFSSVTLSDSDKSLLSKGLNFALPPASLEYSEYLVDYELFFRDTLSLETSYLDRELLKVALRTYPFILSRLIIHPENPTISHLKNLNLSSNKVKIKILLFRNLRRVTLLF